MLSLVFLLPLTNLTSEEPPEFLWAKTAGGIEDDSGEAITTDAAGNLYVVGTFTNSVMFGGTRLQSNGEGDMFVVKHDASGKVMWAKNGGGLRSDFGKGLAVDQGGNVFVSGQFDSWAGGVAYFDTLQLTANSWSANFVVKYDANGTAVWARVAGSLPPLQESPSGVGLDPDGTLYITGQFGGTSLFDSIAVSSHGFEDLFFAKCDANGKFLWVKTVGQQWTDFGSGLAVDSSRNIWVVGMRGIPTASGSDGQLFTGKFDSQGTMLWSQQLGGTNVDVGRGITVDAKGNAYLTGSFQAQSKFGSSMLSSLGRSDLFVAKCDQAGAIVWASQLGSPTTDDFGQGISLDKNGNLYVCGSISNRIAVAKFDPDGKLIWLKSPEGSGTGSARAITVDSNGRIYLTGQFIGDVKFGSVPLKSVGGSDTFIAELASSPAPSQPLITAQPASQSVPAGATADFRVFATGAAPLAFQWSVNGSKLSGATQSMLTLTNITTSQAGEYTVSVSNTAGSVTSDKAILTVRVPSVPPEFLWARVFGGTNYDSVVSAAADKEGNVIFTGYVQPSTTFADVIAQSGINEIPYMAKVSAAGRVLWSRFGVGGSGLALDAAGNIYTCGAFRESIRIGETTFTSHGTKPDLILAKCDPTGKIAWAKQLGGTGDDGEGALAVETSGEITLSGWFEQSTTIEEKSLESDLIGIYVARFDTNGKLLWLYQPESNASNLSVSSVVVDANGNSFITGQFKGDLVFGATKLTNDTAWIAPYKIFLVKLDATGKVLWAQDARVDTANLALDKFGNPHLAGNYFGQGALGNQILPVSRYGDAYVAKYTGDGSSVWADQITGGPTEFETCSGLSIDNDGNVYVTGSFGQQLTLGDINLKNDSGGNDLYVTKCDQDGNFVWAVRAGDNQRRTPVPTKEGKAIVADEAGGVYVLGTAFERPVFNNTILPNFGRNDVFIAKLGSNPSTAQPVITFQPESQSVLAESSIDFNIFASGAAPLQFQWRLNGSNLPSATKAWLSLSEITTSMAGNYSVIVSNSMGSATSAVATLTVNVVAPVITTQPTGLSSKAGLDVSFSVAATGVPRPHVQWRKNGIDLPGKTDTTLQLFNLKSDDAGTYSVAVSNEVTMVISTDAVLTVTPSDLTAPNFLWAKSAGGSSSDSGRSVAMDPEGNVYITGTFSGSATFGTNTVISAGGNDIFIAQYDRAGKEVWVRRAGGSGDDAAQAIALDKAGNAYVTGKFSGSADFGTTTLSSRGSADPFVAKYSKSGEIIWAKSAGVALPASELARGIAVDGSGNVFLVGEFSGTIAIENTNLTSKGMTDVFVAKYDTAGNLVWANRAGGPANDSAAAVGVDAQGNAFVSGFISYPPNFALAVETTFGQFKLVSSGAMDFFVAKYDAAGNVLWALNDGGQKDDFATDLAVDANGNVYVTGKFRGYWNSPATLKQTFVTKYDGSSGRGLWGRQVDGNDPHIAVDGVGNVYMAVSFSGQATFQNTTLVSQGGADIAIAQFDSDGGFRWLKQAGGTSDDTLHGFSASLSGDVSLTGDFSGHASFDSQLIDANGTDIFLAKISTSTAPTLPPSITIQPTSQIALAGANVLFSVSAKGSLPLLYQWQFNGVDLPGATNVILSLANVAPSQTGAYQVVIKNTDGSITSNAARLTVNVLPLVFSVQPRSHTRQVGSDAMFEILATGTPTPVYQWRFNGTNLAGATGTSLILTNITLSHAGQYTVVASNSIGMAVSAAATLTVQLPFEFPPKFSSIQKATVTYPTNYSSNANIAVDKDGNLYFTGAFTGTGKIGQATMSGGALYAPDIFVAKQDKTGRVLWTRTAASASWDFSHGIAVDDNGNTYVTGGVGNTAKFEDTVLTTDGGTDGFVAKYGRDGNLRWVQGIGGSSNSFTYQSGAAIAVDGGGNVYVTGWFEQSVKIGDTILIGGQYATDTQMFLAKYDPSGKPLWARQSKGESVGQNVAVDTSGNVFVVGSFVNSSDFDGIKIVGVSFDAFVAKYDKDGKIIWVKKAGGTRDDAALGVKVDSIGRVWVVGEFTGSATFDSAVIYSAGKTDGFIAQYAPNGQLNWARGVGGSSADAALSLALDQKDNALVIGVYNGPADFGETSFANHGTNSVFVTKIDPDGEIVWAKTANGNFDWPISNWRGRTRSDPGTSIAVDSQGDAYVTGLFNGAVNFDGQEIVTGQSSDIFIAKLVTSEPPPPPIILSQPQSVRAVEGASATFSVTASSVTDPRYQWRFNGADLPNARSATLFISSVQENQSGTYQVQVRNASGTIVSSNAQLMVVIPSWIITVAGSGTSGFRDGTGQAAVFNSPNAIATGPDGSIYIADTLNHRIRRLSSTGDVTTVAGTGVAGFADGPGTSAQFRSPSGLFVNSAGEIFVADTGNFRARKILTDSSRTVMTVAGSGQAGLVDGPSAVAKFDHPTGIVADVSGNLYVSELQNVIRKITPNGDVSTFAGSGLAGNADGVGRNAQFKAPSGLGISTNGTLFVADSGNHLIRKIILTDGTVSTFAGSGLAGLTDGIGKTAQFNSPSGIVADAGGNLFVADTGNHALRKISATGKVTTIAGTGKAGYSDGDGSTAQLNNPSGVALDLAGNVILADSANQRIRLVVVGRPTLSVARAGTNVIFSWPTFAPGFVLEMADEVISGWSPVGAQPLVNQFQNTVTLPIQGQQKFYRLHHP